MATSPNFRRVLSGIHDKKILIPTIRAALASPDFDGFTLEIEPWLARKPDGWFHPSTHATWTARQLTYLLSHPDFFVEEDRDLLFVLAVTQGKFWHTFIQKLLLDHRVLVQAEVPLIDPEHNRRGHTDGRLANGELFEFKTASDHIIKKMDGVVALREYRPEYYAQTQEYLDMAGVSSMRYLVMALSSPFPMIEFAVPADPQFQEAQREKYAVALAAYRSSSLPEPCCAVQSKEARACPARTVCPIGRAS